MAIVWSGLSDQEVVDPAVITAQYIHALPDVPETWNGKNLLRLLTLQLSSDNGLFLKSNVDQSAINLLIWQRIRKNQIKPQANDNS